MKKTLCRCWPCPSRYGKTSCLFVDHHHIFLSSVSIPGSFGPSLKCMAELGVAAAILQIVQLTAQVALKTNIASKLKNAPQIIGRNLGSVRDFIYMLHALESALKVESVDPSCIRNVLSDESRGYIYGLLQRCNEEASFCNSLLSPMIPQDGKMLKEAWKRVLSIKREEDIIQRLRHLDSLRSQISL